MARQQKQPEPKKPAQPADADPLQPQIPEVAKEDRPVGVYAKLAWVMARLHRVPQNGFNEYHGYKYVEEADLVDAVRPLFGAIGLVMIPTVMADERHERKMRGGGTTFLTRATIRYRVLDTDATPDTADWLREFEFDLTAEGEDPMDKGFYKAYTGGNKYALMKLLQISSGEEPERVSLGDMDTPVSGGRAPQRARSERARPEPPPGSPPPEAEPEPEEQPHRLSLDRENAARDYLGESVRLLKGEDLSEEHAEALKQADILRGDAEADHGDLVKACKYLRSLRRRYGLPEEPQEKSPLEPERMPYDPPGSSPAEEARKEAAALAERAASKKPEKGAGSMSDEDREALKSIVEALPLPSLEDGLRGMPNLTVEDLRVMLELDRRKGAGPIITKVIEERKAGDSEEDAWWNNDKE